MDRIIKAGKQVQLSAASAKASVSPVQGYSYPFSSLLAVARGNVGTRPLMLFILVSLAANSPLITHYQLYFGDYTQFDKTLAQWFETRGIWRILGTLFPGWLVSLDVYGVAVVLLHAIGGYLFFLVARRGLGSLPHALFLTVFAIAFPWGDQSLLWTSAVSFAFASCLLRAILYVLVAFRADQLQGYLLAPGVVCTSFICLLFNEAAFFPLCFGGMSSPSRSAHQKPSPRFIFLQPFRHFCISTTIWMFSPFGQKDSSECM